MYVSSSKYLSFNRKRSDFVFEAAIKALGKYFSISSLAFEVAFFPLMANS